MTEKELIELGFRKETSSYDGSDSSSGSDDLYYYYVFDIANGFDLITNANDEVAEDGEWFVEIFDTHPSVRFTDIEEVRVLVNLTVNKVVADPTLSDIVQNDLDIQDTLNSMLNSTDAND